MSSLPAVLLITVAISAPVRAAVPGAALEESLAGAKALYASASYEEALSLLARLIETSSATDARDVEQYRAFCLLALGRTAEAQQVLEALIARNPMYSPGDDEASPRVRSTFHAIRARLLPDLAQQMYVTAKASYDAKNYAAALNEFDQAVNMLSDPDVSDSTAVHDLIVVAEGFRELSRAAVPSPAADAAASSRTMVERAPAAGDSSGLTGMTANVTAPSAIRQDLPPWSPPRGQVAQSTYYGLLEVVIDERGDVESETLVDPVHPIYDRLLLASARAWKYLPAMRDGKPVKYVKQIEVVLQPK